MMMQSDKESRAINGIGDDAFTFCEDADHQKGNIADHLELTSGS